MTATYTKLRSGEWGVRVTGALPAQGSTIQVTKKDGTRNTVTVNRVEWSGTVRGVHVSMCSIKSEARGTRATPHMTGMATDAQHAYLTKLLRRIRGVSQFDSWAGTGDSMADETEQEIRDGGGYSKLTRVQASVLIDKLRGYLDDEM